VEILFAALGKKIGTEHPTRLGARPKKIMALIRNSYCCKIFSMGISFCLGGTEKTEKSHQIACHSILSAPLWQNILPQYR
jgi:hypothetical protein